MVDTALKTRKSARQRAKTFVTVVAICSAAVSALHGEEANAAAERDEHRSEVLKEIDQTIEAAISEGRAPGGVFVLERGGRTYRRAYGLRAVEPEREEMTEATIFDVASLTKVVATTPAVMLLVQRGEVALDEPVKRYIPEFGGDGRDAVTVRHLLTHTSGLRPGISLRPAWSGYERAIELACAETPRHDPGTAFVYSDINFILLGELVRRVGGDGLEVFVRNEIYGPLGMETTAFLPPEEWKARIAPTQRAGDGILRGVVHDPTARAMNGVAGHAGLFSTAGDLARFARMMLNRGELDGVRVFEAETVDLMTAVQTPETLADRRGLGWDIDSRFSRPRGSRFPLGSYGHTGWTGGCLWIDPFSGTFWMFLSNRVHPDGTGNVLDLQRALADLAADAITGFDFENVPGALPPRD